MVHSSSLQSRAFEASAHDRLAAYATRAGMNAVEIVALTPDVSTREYFRLPWQGRTAIAAVYQEPFDPDIHPFLDVTRLFIEARLPVPKILDVDALNGIILQEDLGDRQLGRIFESASEDQREAYLERAIALIAEIQAATAKAFERDSIASRLAFDEPKLIWELNYFLEHYFKSLRRQELKRAEEKELRAEMNDLAADLAARPRVLCHRDYHSANLMVDDRGQLRVVDYQDARMGPSSYDLVSLLLDRQTAPPSLAEVRERRLFFLDERRRHGLETIDPDEFAQEFRLMTVQRCLKATGTFAYQTAVAGRGEVYAHYIQPMLQIVLQAAGLLNRFPVLQRIIRQHVDEEK